MPDDCLADLARLGVLVVTQPNFVAERGDQYLADVPDDEHHQLWRVASLLAADVKVVLSTDMPFGDADPWAAMRAAVHRTTAAGAVLGPAERIDARTALECSSARPIGRRRRARSPPAGRPNLCVITAAPDELLHELDADMVAATIVEGSVVFEELTISSRDGVAPAIDRI